MASLRQKESLHVGYSVYYHLVLHSHIAQRTRMGCRRKTGFMPSWHMGHMEDRLAVNEIGGWFHNYTTTYS